MSLLLTLDLVSTLHQNPAENSTQAILVLSEEIEQTDRLIELYTRKSAQLRRLRNTLLGGTPARGLDYPELLPNRSMMTATSSEPNPPSANVLNYIMKKLSVKVWIRTYNLLCEGDSGDRHVPVHHAQNFQSRYCPQSWRGGRSQELFSPSDQHTWGTTVLLRVS